MTGGAKPRPYTRLPMMCPFYVRGDAPQGYLLRCVGIALYEITGGVCVYISGGQSRPPLRTFTEKSCVLPPAVLFT